MAFGALNENRMNCKNCVRRPKGDGACACLGFKPTQEFLDQTNHQRDDQPTDESE